ncbi:hypothetical protein MEDNBIBF_00025 [Escherichia phage SR02]|uniref:Uncharacterized protein n=1 Tax=Escherichia phage SR02 TaxID=3056226 RepID=A0AA50F0I0_9CAUD|nr:hypothetical protein MEDNBIBF_00025 [Escherichia phage SR02]
MEIKVSEHKYANIEDIKSGDVFSYDKRFWLMLDDDLSNGLRRAADLSTGHVGNFNPSSTVMPRPDLHLTQK